MGKLILALSDIKEYDDINIKFEKEFRKMGCFLETNTVHSLEKVVELLNTDIDYKIVILNYNLEIAKYLTTNYLREIRKNHQNLVITCIIEDRYYNSSYMGELIEAGIYNGVFKKDASMSNIVYISLNPRTEKEAEGYYGLNDCKNETERIVNSSLTRTLMINKKSRNDVVIKERVVYRTPSDYQKVIGIYSPYSVGKTVLAVNLARYYEKNKLSVTLIDTDYYKKDIMYYYKLKSTDYLKMQKLYKRIKLGKEINDITEYEINIKKNLKLFTDHRDSIYKIVYPMIHSIIRCCDSNLLIIDISKDLDKQLVNEILSLCDERIIIADKMITTLNGLPYKLYLNRYNNKNLNLVVNRDVSLKSLTNREIVQHFKNIKPLGKEKYNLDFNNVFFVPDKFNLIAESLSNREAAYGKDKDFDRSIEKIGASLYYMGLSR